MTGQAWVLVLAVVLAPLALAGWARVVLARHQAGTGQRCLECGARRGDLRRADVCLARPCVVFAGPANGFDPHVWPELAGWFRW